MSKIQVLTLPYILLKGWLMNLEAGGSHTLGLKHLVKDAYGRR